MSPLFKKLGTNLTSAQTRPLHTLGKNTWAPTASRGTMVYMSVPVIENL